MTTEREALAELCEALSHPENVLNTAARYAYRSAISVLAQPEPEPTYDAEFIGLQREELAALPDVAVAASFRDIAGRNYREASACLFRAHVIEKARTYAAPPAPAQPTRAPEQRAADKAHMAAMSAQPTMIPPEESDEEFARQVAEMDAKPAQATINAAVERVRNTIIVEGEPPENLREAIAQRVADLGKPTAQPTLTDDEIVSIVLQTVYENDARTERTTMSMNEREALAELVALHDQHIATGLVDPMQSAKAWAEARSVLAQPATTYRQRAVDQLRKWVDGESHHNTVDDECCPDFSCCNPSLFETDPARREAIARALKGQP